MSARASGLVLCALLSACGDSGSTRPDLEPQRFVIEQPALTESSGLARSQRDADLYWSHNDSGGPTELYAFDGEGKTRGILQLQLALNIDWEDMTSFVEDGVPRLLVGDVGDNGAIRPLITVYIVDEPALDAGASTQSALALRQIQILYPDGPKDCEAIAVDAAEGMIYLLSKRDAIPRLYRVPLQPLLPLAMAEALGEINIPRAPEGTENPERINWVTSMDFDAEHRRAAVVTLTQAYVYERAEGESWIDAFQREPLSVDIPDESQIEAIAWSADGRELVITSEGSPTPAAHIPLAN